ncbi:PIN domain-containing protein [Candidatus Pacearchaeota archaeon]|nr:PIN domain-containing protein [Candidatus Pacearchaeota archaeon]
MKYIIDAYGWIEYLNGSLAGEKINKILKEDHDIYSISMTISEVVSKVKRKKGNVDVAYNSIISNSKIIEITPKIAKEAGLLHAETRKEIENFGLVDAILIIIARHANAKILTNDFHFKNFKETILI